MDPIGPLFRADANNQTRSVESTQVLPVIIIQDWENKLVSGENPICCHCSETLFGVSGRYTGFVYNRCGCSVRLGPRSAPNPTPTTPLFHRKHGVSLHPNRYASIAASAPSRITRLNSSARITHSAVTGSAIVRRENHRRENHSIESIEGDSEETVKRGRPTGLVRPSVVHSEGTELFTATVKNRSQQCRSQSDKTATDVTVPH